MWFKKVQRIDGSARASCFFSGIKKTWSQQKGAGARASFNHGISTVEPNVASEGMRFVKNPGMLKRPKHWPRGMGENVGGTSSLDWKLDIFVVGFQSMSISLI